MSKISASDHHSEHVTPGWILLLISLLVAGVACWFELHFFILCYGQNE